MYEASREPSRTLPAGGERERIGRQRGGFARHGQLVHPLVSELKRAASDDAAKGERAGRGGDKKSKSHDAILIPPDLEALGVNASQSSRWQKLAASPHPRALQ